MSNEDRVFIPEGTLDIDFNSVAFDNKKDFNKVKSDMKLACKKIMDDYNSMGSEIDFTDGTSGEYD